MLNLSFLAPRENLSSYGFIGTMNAEIPLSLSDFSVVAKTTLADDA